MDCELGGTTFNICNNNNIWMRFGIPKRFLFMNKHTVASLLLPPDAYDINTHQVMGRRVAGRSFAEGLCKSLEQYDKLTIITGSREAIPQLQKILQPLLQKNVEIRLYAEINSDIISEGGCLHLPDPGLHNWCWLRAGMHSNSFSITGVTHTLCSNRVMQGLEQLVTAPLEPWDALICTSRSAKSVVLEAMDCMHERLEKKFNTRLEKIKRPRLPIIPLGIDTSSYRWEGKFDSRQDQRYQARKELDLPGNAKIILYLGRLSFHSKAHPLPLYKAINELSQDKEIILLECGHIYNKTIEKAYTELQKNFPSLRIKRLGGLVMASEKEKKLALAAADIFCSPADNLQETFGLTILEAMASSLPVVASNWNGYRDLIINGVTGLLIPTSDILMNQLSTDKVDREYGMGLRDYDSTVGLRSLGVVVNNQKLKEALNKLLLNDNMCKKMGEAAEKHVQTQFTWQIVSNKYKELWDELNKMRTERENMRETNIWSVPNTARLFKNHAYEKPTNGPWIIDKTCIDAAILMEEMQTCFLKELVEIQKLEYLVEYLKNKDTENIELSSKNLFKAYEKCDIDESCWVLITSVLTKLAIIKDQRA